jgi:rhamnose transport system substrate-binding protein
MHHRRRALLAALPVALLLAASVLPVALSHSAAATRPHDHFAVFFLPKATGNPYFDTAFSGARAAAAADGDTVKQVGPTSADASQQVTYIKSLIQQHVDAIVVSADDPGVIAPALKQAISRGIKVVSYDSDTLPSARQIFVNQADTAAIGRIEVQIMARELGYKGQIAILSAASTATNQNAWISYMKKELALPRYQHMQLVTIVYGNDDPQLSTTDAQGLLTKYPHLRGIIAPTTVGIKAAAQVVDVARKRGKVIVTGLGTPNDMRKYVLNGTVPDFALWNPANLGYLAEYTAHDLAAGMLKPVPAARYKAGKLGTYVVGPQRVVLLGPPTEFTRKNINQFHF